MLHWGAHYHIGFWLEPGEWSQRLPGPALPRPHCQAQLAEGHPQAAEQIGRTRKPCPLCPWTRFSCRASAAGNFRPQFHIVHLHARWRHGALCRWTRVLGASMHGPSRQQTGQGLQRASPIHIHIYIYTQRQPNKKAAMLGGTRHPFFWGGVPCGPLPGAWTFKLRDHGMQIRTAESYLVRRGPGRACQETLEMSRTWPQ